MQYERIQTVSEETVLACYLEPGRQPKTVPLPETIIYHLSLWPESEPENRDRKRAVLSNQHHPESARYRKDADNPKYYCQRSKKRKTVAVVSNNNSATLNVAEKLEKKGLSFLTAFLGSISNKERFLETQTGRYPDMGEWILGQEEKTRLNREVTALSKELNDMLNAKNRIAEIEQEFLQLRPEQYYFDEYYQTYAQAPRENLSGLSSQKILNLWLEYEQHAEHESRLGLLKKLSIMFRFNLSALKIFLQSPELVIPYLQRQFYVVRQRELTEERIQLEQRLANYSFSEKMEELTEKSLRLFRTELSNAYPSGLSGPVK